VSTPEQPHPIESMPTMIGELPEPEDPKSSENPIIGWAKAVVLGIGDTAKDMLREGKRGARQGMDEGWDRFDAKTKHRRSSKQ